jgi:hypothetical protein
MAKTKGARRSDSFGKTEARERMTVALRAALSMGPVPHGTTSPSKNTKVKSRPKKRGTAKD